MGPLTRAEATALAARLRAVAGDGLVVCEVGALRADLAAVEALARLRLAARRLGCPLHVRGASPELEALLARCGLREALLPGPEPLPDQPAPLRKP